MSCYVLDVSEFGYHEKLGQNGKCLQPDTVAPQQLEGRKRLMDKHGHNCSTCIQIIVWECVRLFVVAEGEWLADADKIGGIEGDGNEYNFHEEEIEGFPAHEDIDVSGDKDHSIDFLCAVGES